MFRISLLSVFLFVVLPALPQTFAFADEPDFLIMRGAAVGNDDPIAATTVAILNQSGGQLSLCSGSVVAPDLVVTAAHCVGPRREGMRIAFTTDIRRLTGTLVPVSGFIRPKDYGHTGDGQAMDDVALIRFEGGLPPGYRPAQLLPDPGMLRNGERVTLAGYGVTGGSPGLAGAGVLRRVDVAIAQSSYERTEVVMDQRDGRGACHGDSGGPAFLRRGDTYLLFGVTSRGTSVGGLECVGASVYSSIMSHAAFFQSAAEALRRGQSM